MDGGARTSNLNTREIAMDIDSMPNAVGHPYKPAQWTIPTSAIFGVGTGKGMVALFEGKTDVAISSNTLEESIKSAQKVRKKAEQ